MKLNTHQSIKPVKMAGTRTAARYAKAEPCRPAKPRSAGGRVGGMEPAGNSTGRGLPARWSPNFETIDGLLYRKKLERGFFNYREVLDEGRRPEALSTFHRRRLGQRHLSLEETYKCVAENYWWEGMYFQIRDYVLGCLECQRTKKTEEPGGRGCVTKTMVSHSADMLSRLRSQREAGQFCDITLRTNGRSYAAHRAVLAAVSDHFQEIFTEMDSNIKADIDLTGFREDSLLSLLDFSYSSTLCVRQEDLPEVIAMARHLGMWPAVEACSALMKEQEQRLHPGKDFTPPACACHKRYCPHREGKRKRVFGLEDDVDHGLSLEASEESLEASPRRNLRRTPRAPGLNGLPLSPSHRMKLMDFKSPSSKKAAAPRHVVTNPQPQNYSRVSPPNTRLLRSTPGAAEEVQRLLPAPESPRRNRKAAAAAGRLSRGARSRVAKIAARSPVRIKQEPEDVCEDEQDHARAQEKYELMNVLGLQRTALLPRPEDLIGWRQKKRLRKLKANNYSLTKRRKPRSPSPGRPYGALALSLPLCDPVNTHLLQSVKARPVGPVGKEQMAAKRPKAAPRRVPPSDRVMRSQGALPDVFQPASRPPYGGRELRRSVRMGGGAQLPVQQPRRPNADRTLVRNAVGIKSEPSEYSVSGFPLSSSDLCSRAPPPHRTRADNAAAVETVKTPRYNGSRPAPKAKLRRGSAREVGRTKRTPGEEAGETGQSPVKVNDPGGLPCSESPASIYNHPLYKVIKEEPADPVPVGGPYSEPPSPDLGKRQSKPPIKLLDSGFLFSFCRPAGLKKEEESVDICLTRSVSQAGPKFGAEESPHRALRARGPPGPPAARERSARRPRPNARQTAKPAESKATRTTPKRGAPPPSSRSCVVLDAASRARLRQLRGPRSQVPKAAHDCVQCSTSYKDCDALIMHRLRHVEGKHWPCLLCSKMFFRLRNVRNHIRTHDPKLYKCRSCVAAAGLRRAACGVRRQRPVVDQRRVLTASVTHTSATGCGEA
ncbi:Zinc finger and BTB domain-containing protein 11 [Liparis tanakae]|uniref:Zinc finger and BTB domain-containing protein 11 n=1 Tax=Liparis tanakae TaxID=230148 RepID=A0A4Z2FG86_9TELE|nr:Zinc finger and BTB domain-containing protein 11 [Liparis tanakae]